MNALAVPALSFDVTQKFTGRADDAPKNAETDKVAKDFESVFVSLMLKTMRQSMSEDMFAGDNSDTFGGMFDMYMGQHIAENGGIGLSRFFDSLAKVSGGRSPGDATSNVPGSHQSQLEAYRHVSNS